MKKNPFKDRDLNDILRFPMISWSSFNAFKNYDKDEWYESYVLGKKSEPNKAMLFGQFIGEKLAINEKFLPHVPRPAIYEQELRGKLGNIELVGHLDGLTLLPKCELIEYKTTTNPNKWNQETVDNWGQITFYCLLLYMNFKIVPEDIYIRLVSIIGQEEDDSFDINVTNEAFVFETKRTLKDLLKFGAELRATHKEMIKFVNEKQK